MAKSVYEIIKKQNGEGFARVLRDANVLDMPNIAHIVKYAGHTEQDANDIRTYLWGLRSFNTVQTSDTPGDPFELLHRAGYEFVEYADTLEKQNAIAKYFRNGEKLCTFNDPTRYQNHYIINAVKYNIESIKPARHGTEQRQDEYGTSVISIQIQKPTDGTRKSNKISIKNRYNHTVNNPDNTFNSNPDEIILGLSAALKTYFDVDWQASTNPLPDNFTLIGDQLIKYNFEINNCYIGNDFYEQHGQIHEIDKNSQVMMDYFIYDFKQQKLLNPSGVTGDAFVKSFNKETAGKKLTITGDKHTKQFLANGVTLLTITDGKITAVNFPNVTEIGDNFLFHNRQLTNISLPKLTNTDSLPEYIRRKIRQGKIKNSLKKGVTRIKELMQQSSSTHNLNNANKDFEI